MGVELRRILGDGCTNLADIVLIGESEAEEYVPATGIDAFFSQADTTE
jgi:hypothetical protein